MHSRLVNANHRVGTQEGPPAEKNTLFVQKTYISYFVQRLSSRHRASFRENNTEKCNGT